MSDIYLSTVFSKSGLPLHTCVSYNGNVSQFDLYVDDTDLTIEAVEQRVAQLAKMFYGQKRVILTDFMAYFKGFKLSPEATYNVYDQHFEIPVVPTAEVRQAAVDQMTKLQACEILPYQKVAADAAVVYSCLTKAGLSVAETDVKPQWSMATYSGRSKCLGFNVQGFVDELTVRSPFYYDCDVLLHFDWIAADIRVAAHFAQDEVLERSFLESDPYTFLAEDMARATSETLSRDECKLFVLKCINSFDHEAMSKTCYPKLGAWIKRLSVELKDSEVSRSILGRKFYGGPDQVLSRLNGIMQGSVAHAMQIVLRKAWDKYNYRVIGDIHDSLVISTKASEMKEVVRTIGPIMLHPFEGLLPENPCFPFVINIGKIWRRWSKTKAIRSINDFQTKTVENTTQE